MLRRLFAACGLLACCLGGLAMAVDVKSYKIGDMELIALADRPVDPQAANRPQLFVNISPEAEKLLKPGAMANSVNCFIVKKAGEILLFDTGLGKKSGGQLQEALAAAGVKPEEVDTVIITHFHPDHIGGLVTEDRQAAFPKAQLWVGRMEVEGMPKESELFMGYYAGRLNVFEWNHDVAKGVKALEAPGHTPGHTIYLVEDGKTKLLIIGDLIHFQNIQLPYPDTAVAYDKDPRMAVASRKIWFDYAAKPGHVVAGMHLAFPGVGVLAKQGSGYTFSAK